MSTAAVQRAGEATGRRRSAGRVAILVVLLGYLVVTRQVAHATVYNQDLILVAAVFAILAISLDLVAGMAGLYSLGHAGLFALGAYATTLLNEHRGWNVFLLLPVCLVGGALVGVVLGSLSLRVSGLYFAITTFVFTLVIGVLASDLQITGGLQGISGPLFPDFPYSIGGLGSALVWCVSGCLLVTMALVWCIRQSPLYPVLLAIRDAEPFAAAAGVRTSVVKVAVFALSAALAAMAGWAFSFLGFVSPGQFSWTVSVNILVMVILGGINTTWGPPIGAAFISVFPVYVHIDPLIQELLFGTIFVLVIVFAPGGAVGVAGQLGRRWGLTGRTVADDAVVPGPLAGAEPEPVSAARLTRPAELTEIERRDAVTAMPVVDCRGIEFSYRPGTPVLQGVDFVVRPGTIHGLIGPNGSGKSTLVNLICGQLTPVAGTISVNGARVDRLGAPSRPGVGLMRTFQTAVLVRELPAQDNVAIGRYSAVARIGTRAAAWPLLPGARRDSRRLASDARDALRRVGMDRWRQVRIADVPHGVEQLTQLAAATASDPSVLLLDEPLAGLSTGEVATVSRLLAELRARGTSVIVIEHQTKFIFEMCDEVTVLAAGQLVTSGPAATVRADARVREVYLGQ